jgi:hypothetical protein
MHVAILTLCSNQRWHPLSHHFNQRNLQPICTRTWTAIHTAFILFTGAYLFFKSSLSEARNTARSQSCEKYCIHFALGLTFCNLYSFCFFGLFCILCIYVEERTNGSRRKGFFFTHTEIVLIPRCYPRTFSAQSIADTSSILTLVCSGIV